jgi:hypothetical protein
MAELLENFLQLSPSGLAEALKRYQNAPKMLGSGQKGGSGEGDMKEVRCCRKGRGKITERLEIILPIDIRFEV